MTDKHYIGVIDRGDGFSDPAVAGNWSPSGVPATGDNLFFDSTPTYFPMSASYTAVPAGTYGTLTVTDDFVWPGGEFHVNGSIFAAGVIDATEIEYGLVGGTFTSLDATMAFPPGGLMVAAATSVVLHQGNILSGTYTNVTIDGTSSFHGGTAAHVIYASTSAWVVGGTITDTITTCAGGACYLTSDGGALDISGCAVTVNGGLLVNKAGAGLTVDSSTMIYLATTSASVTQWGIPYDGVDCVPIYVSSAIVPQAADVRKGVTFNHSSQGTLVVEGTRLAKVGG